MTISITKDTPSANRIAKGLHALTGAVTMDNSYATGGEALTDIIAEFKDVKRITFTPRKSGLGAYFDDTNSDIRVFRHVEGGDHQHVFRVSDDNSAASTGSSVFGTLSGCDLRLFTATGYEAEIESAYWRSQDANGHSHSIPIVYGAPSGSVADNNIIPMRVRADAYASGIALLYDQDTQGGAKLEGDQKIFLRTTVAEGHYHWIPVAPKTTQFMHSEGPDLFYIDHNGTAADNLLCVTTLNADMELSTYDGEVEAGTNLSGVIFDFQAYGTRQKGLSG